MDFREYICTCLWGASSRSEYGEIACVREEFAYIATEGVEEDCAAKSCSMEADATVSNFPSQRRKLDIMMASSANFCQPFKISQRCCERCQADEKAFSLV